MIQSQIDDLRHKRARQSAVPPEDALRLADGAVRDASAKHDQAMARLLKCRDAVEEAQEKERLAAL
eukprot:6957152-Pyramimonas_sp.AAC.1